MFSSENQALSDEEAEQFAARIASIADSNLPLADGLRAASQEHQTGPMADALNQIADMIDSGTPLQNAIGGISKRFPKHIAGVVSAACGGSAFAPVLSNFVNHQKKIRSLSQLVSRSLLYPIFLLFISMSVIVFVSWFSMDHVTELVSILKESEITPDSEAYSQITRAVGTHQWLGENGPQYLLALVVILILFFFIAPLILGRSKSRQVLTTVPIFGSMYHWAGVAELSSLMAILIRQQVSIPNVLRTAGNGVADASLQKVCQTMADRVEQGEQLSELIRKNSRLPATLAPFVGSNMSENEIAENLNAASEMYFDMASDRAQMIRAILPPLILLCAGGMIIVWLAGMLSGISTIQMLLFSF